MESLTNDLHGKGDQLCSKCSYTSVGDLPAGEGLCPFHFVEYSCGKGAAVKKYSEYPPVDLIDLYTEGFTPIGIPSKYPW